MGKKVPHPVAASVPAIPQLLHQARLAHAHNELARAEALYRAVLGAQAGNVEALSNLGGLYHQLGRYQQAAELMARALQFRPGAPDLLSNLGVMLLALGRPAAALGNFDQALEQLPAHPVIHYNRGNALLKLSRPADALSAYDRALALKPDYAEVQGNRGVALRLLRRYEDALAALRVAVDSNGASAELHNELGLALRELKRYPEALESFRQAVLRQPDYPEALNNAGVVLSRMKQRDHAMVAFDQALQLRPNYFQAINNKATLLLEMNRPEDALAIGEQALGLNPIGPAMQVRAQALLDLNRPEEAVASLDRFSSEQEDAAASYSMRGNALLKLGRFEEALASHRQAVALDPGKPTYQWNLGNAELTLGDFTNGWRHYECRWQVEDLLRSETFEGTHWTGDVDIAGRDILLYAEQGFGDTIQFCRYATLVAALGACVTLRVQPSLKDLLSSLRGVTRVVSSDEPAPSCAFKSPLLSLPLAFNTALDTVPGEVPYLFADPQLVTAWRTRLPGGDKPKIGLAVSGNPTHKNDCNRSMPLAELAPILSADAHFILLQNVLPERDRDFLTRRPDIRYYGTDLRSFADTAALVENLDLVIAVDTSVAHLAGALGKPVWLMLPLAPDWRWLLERQDSPWYPTARLFRQARFAEWDSVVTRVHAALCQRYGWAGRSS